ncbi:hypothetical protein FNF31_02114 [Cafeteria roenbergensis]|uniref:Exostosin GT47 domain-containing protein n=1 Tax=Cafeteria roenbergensis TaxID=33653 RepID=A0A5A8DMI4_CAFRO|nr:hypothetical protein FNF31_02114 [Cafeteria roenbergensis]
MAPVVCLTLALPTGSETRAGKCVRLQHASDLFLTNVSAGRLLFTLSAHVPVGGGAVQQVADAFAGRVVAPLEALRHLLSAPKGRRQFVKVVDDAYAVTVVNRFQCRFGEHPCMTPAAERPHCGSVQTFRFLLFPEEDAKRAAFDNAAATQGAHTPRAAHASLMRLLLAHPLRTTDPAEACVRIPAINTVCAPSGCASLPVQAAALARLKLWQGGRDGLVWDMGDHQTRAETGMAVRAKSSFGPPWDVHKALRLDLIPAARTVLKGRDIPNHEPLNQGFDVPVPLSFYRCSRPLFAHLERPEAGPDGRLPAPGWLQRDVLASFAGGLYGLEEVGHPASVRVTLARVADALELEQHAGNSTAAGARGTPGQRLPLPVVVRGACDTRGTPLCDGTIKSMPIVSLPECERWSARIDSEALAMRRSRAFDSGVDRDRFDQLIRRSRFAFAPAGEGTHSYRLLEALRDGAVPVMLCSAALPFDEIIDWSRVAVVHTDDCSAEGLRRLVDRLSAVSREEWEGMQAAGRDAFERYLATPQRHVDATFITLAGRFRAAAKRQGAQALLAGDETTEAAAAGTLLSRRGWAATRALGLARPLPLALRPESQFESGAPDGPRSHADADRDGVASPPPAPRVPSGPRELAWAEGEAVAPPTCTAVLELLPPALHPTRDQGPSLSASLLAQLATTEPDSLLRALCEGLGPGQGLRSSAWFEALHSFVDMRSASAAFFRARAGSSTQAMLALRDALGIAASTTARLLVKAVRTCTPTAAQRAARRAPAAAVMFLAGDAFHVGCRPREAATAMHAAIVLATMPEPAPEAKAAAEDGFWRAGEDAQARPDVPVLDAEWEPAPQPALPWISTDDVVSGLQMTTASLQALLRAGAAAMWERGAVPFAPWWAPLPAEATAPLPAVLGLAAGAEQAWPRGEAAAVRSGGEWGEWAERVGGEAAGRVLPVLPEPRVSWPAAGATRSGFAAAWERLRLSAEAAGPGWDPAEPWIRASREAHLARDGSAPPPHAQCLLDGSCSVAAPPPQQARWPAARVAIVTLCAYDSSRTSITARSMANRLAYCGRHGYHCVLETSRQPGHDWPPAWDKVHLLRQHQDAAEWVAWVDCDSFFTNFSLPLEGVLARAGALGPPEEAEAGGAAEERGVVLVASEDGASLNTGVLLLRRSPEGARLLEEVWAAAEAGYGEHPWWEQAAFIDALTLGRAADELDGRMVMLPQGAINGYAPELAAKFNWNGRPLHALWRRGDLIVSFSGCARMTGSSDTCESLLAAADSEWRLAQRADLLASSPAAPSP